MRICPVWTASVFFLLLVLQANGRSIGFAVLENSPSSIVRDELYQKSTELQSASQYNLSLHFYLANDTASTLESIAQADAEGVQAIILSASHQHQTVMDYQRQRYQSSLCHKLMVSYSTLAEQFIAIEQPQHFISISSYDSTLMNVLQVASHLPFLPDTYSIPIPQPRPFLPTLRSFLP